MAQDSHHDNIHAEIAGLKKGLEAQENSVNQLRELITQRFGELSESIQNINNNQTQQSYQNNGGNKQIGLISIFIAALAAVAAPIGVTLSFQQNAFSSHVREAKEARENIKIDFVKRDDRIIDKQDEIRNRVDNLESDISKHTGMASVRFKEMDDQIEKFNKTISSEIQSTQKLLLEKIKNLDTTLQREMRLLDKTNEKDVEALREQIEILERRLRTLEMIRDNMTINRSE